MVSYNQKNIQIENLEPHERKWNRDLQAVSKIGTLNKFFGYFKNKYPQIKAVFRNYHPKSQNCYSLFNSLKTSLEWTNVYSYKLRSFNYLQEGVYQKYLNVNLSRHNIKFNSNDHYELKFEKLAEKLLWKDYAKLFTFKFNELVGAEAERISQDLKSLQEIIKRYKLLRKNEKIPDDIDECKKIIKNYLFVNIYDFINLKKKEVLGVTYFDNIRDLSIYTRDNKLFYPLQEAKENFIYKVLLKVLLF
jgi:hypothetical protein